MQSVQELQKELEDLEKKRGLTAKQLEDISIEVEKKKKNFSSSGHWIGGLFPGFKSKDGVDAIIQDQSFLNAAPTALQQGRNALQEIDSQIQVINREIAKREFNDITSETIEQLDSFIDDARALLAKFEPIEKNYLALGHIAETRMHARLRVETHPEYFLIRLLYAALVNRGGLAAAVKDFDQKMQTRAAGNGVAKTWAAFLGRSRSHN
jgi:hypothetical protein